ncbi:hypothetical protein [Bacillus sp. FJAT-29937]|uniref:hypothetical protein n=1 Tax=Bacillus sp. FJAT-29937 TaxID=1720553 RepID=UPI000836D72A|nr:hypothetical protein [Bacillus sp. FJAT-29937]
MITIIFSIVSLVILTPVLLFMPIGISNKWKICLVGVAFLLANIGLMANMQIPFYQAILIIVLLCGLIALLLEKRVVAIPQSKVESESIHKKIISIEKETVHSENEKLNIIIEKENLTTVISEVAVSSEISQEDDDLIKLAYSIDKQDEAAEEIKIGVHKKFETEKTENPLDFDEDVSFLENRVAAITIKGEVGSTDLQENHSEKAYMSEIERLLDGNDIGDGTEKMPNTITPISQPVMEELEEIVFTKELQIKEDNKKSKDLNEEIEIEELIFHK